MSAAERARREDYYARSRRAGVIAARAADDAELRAAKRAYRAVRGTYAAKFAEQAAHLAGVAAYREAYDRAFAAAMAEPEQS